MKKEKLTILLHGVQHLCLVLAAVAAAIVLLSSFVTIEGRKGREIYQLHEEDKDTPYIESQIFNRLLGNSVSDIICYGAIRAQLETDGKFDPQKVIDVTAFANRYNGMQQEYITAGYYLEDLIKWAQSGFEYEDVYMTGNEVDSFLSRRRTVTKVDIKDGGNVSYLNSDLGKFTTIVDVSGNMIDDGSGSVRDDAQSVIMDNRYHSVDGKNIEDYVFSWEEYYELCNNVAKAAEDLSINYGEYLTYKDYYDESNSNVVYYIRRTIGADSDVFSNRKVDSNNLGSLKKQLKDSCNKYIIYDPKNMSYETNTLIEESTLRHILKGYEYAYPEDTQILIGVTVPYQVTDAFSEAQSRYMQYMPYLHQHLAMAIIGIFLYLLLMVVLTIREGKETDIRTEEKTIRLKSQDRIPTEIMVLLTGAAVAVIILVGEILRNLDFPDTEQFYINMGPGLAGLAAFVISICFSFFYYSYVRRIKAGTLWKNSLIRQFSKKVVELGMYLYDNSTIVIRALVPALALFFLNMFLCVLIKSDTGLLTFVLIFTMFADGAAIAFSYKTVMDRQRILRGLKQINAGDMEHKIDENSLHGDNLVLAREVNSIGEGIRNAVSTSMKDERLKADLITNVSHDIKTPLTSIINYVDLIKRENIDNPKVKEYIEILDTKSQRLKQLTDDLVEASKISSGNIVLQWEKINLIELLNQTIGEFSEKFEQKNLSPVIRSGKNSIYIEADSRRIWRVIENLFNNVFKYALAGTRVYIDVEEIKTEKKIGRVALSIKNISENPIKVNSDELTERFIRGDESRTTEGSGLGLSIAKNLTEVMKGEFEITVDGDLFKVTLTFPLLEKN